MLRKGDARIGLDAPTVTAEDDGFLTKVMVSPMDVRKVITLIGAFYWTIMTVFVVPGIIAATFLTVMVPALCIRLVCSITANCVTRWIQLEKCKL